MNKTVIKLIVSICTWAFFVSCASGPASVSEDELYSLGKAYYDLGKYSEAEVWFQRASNFKKTKNASMYYLGRIAFQQQKYENAARIFEALLKSDQDNVLLLKAAAFSNLKAQKFEKAELQYKRVIELVPGSKDSTYGYALVLYGLQKYDDAYRLLKDLKADSDEDRDALLLLARTEYKLSFPEALDHYSKWLEKGDDPVVLKEFAEVAEQQALYSRAIEAYKKIKQTNRAEAAGLQKGEIDFLIGRLIMIADPSDSQGKASIETSLSLGYVNKEKIDALLADSRLSETQRQSLVVLFTEKSKK
uniref:Tetratricopeptide repeat protein n=1 Tax=Gracilinema caldarium TaxID=215591 RepID=A0A7C3HZ66_9SPIR